MAELILTCRFGCGAAFTMAKPLPASAKWRKPGKDRMPEGPVIQQAHHEMKCELNPHRAAPHKEGSAWTPIPWGIKHGGAKPQPEPTRLTYLDGPWHGRKQNFEAFLVDGTRLSVAPAKITPGPQMVDSQGRSCSRYMGHYELQVVRRKAGRCLVYQWIDTITPKKRLKAPRTFDEAFPDLDLTLTLEERDDQPEPDPAPAAPADGEAADIDGGSDG